MTKPIVTFRNRIGDAEYAAVIRRQRKYLRDAADRHESGDPLAATDRALAAWALHNAADRLSEAQPRPVGQPPIVDPGLLAMQFAFMVTKADMSDNKAHEALSEHHEISITAVKKALEKYGAAAVRLLGGPKLPTKTNRRK
jgi:hypothetical protein